MHKVLAITILFVISTFGLSHADEVTECQLHAGCEVINCGSEVFLCTRGSSMAPSWNCKGNSVDGPGASLCRLAEYVSCGTSDPSVSIYGRKRDIVRIQMNGDAWSSGVLETGARGGAANKLFGNRYPIRCNDDILSASNYVTVRHGRDLDLFWLVGVSEGGIVPLFVRLQDGRQLGVEERSQGPLIILGRNKDVYIQYCFDGTRWTSSDVLRARPRPDQRCGSDAVVFFNVSEVLHSPRRPKPICHGYPRDGWHPSADGVRCHFVCDPDTGRVHYDPMQCYQLPEELEYR